MAQTDVEVAIVGAGVVGCAAASLLAARGRSVALLEAGPRIAEGVTSRNSGVIHSGLYYPPGSLKARTCVRGNRLLYQWAARRLLGDVHEDQLAWDGCGIRPKLRAPGESEEKDFVLSEDRPGFVNLIGIESPGLTAALALAELPA